MAFKGENNCRYDIDQVHSLTPLQIRNNILHKFLLERTAGDEGSSRAFIRSRCR